MVLVMTKGDTVDELNAMAKDLDWAERLKNTEDYLNPDRSKKKGFRGWLILIAFVLGLGLSSIIFYWWDPINEWLSSLPGL